MLKTVTRYLLEDTMSKSTKITRAEIAGERLSLIDELLSVLRARGDAYVIMSLTVAVRGQTLRTARDRASAELLAQVADMKAYGYSASMIESVWLSDLLDNAKT